MTQPHHRNRHPKYRKLYKIQNWQEYERSLIQRGDLTIWLSEDVIQSWYDDSLNQLGRPKLYSDVAIETVLTLRLLFKLPLRQTEGFLTSIFTRSDGVAEAVNKAKPHRDSSRGAHRAAVRRLLEWIKTVKQKSRFF